MRVLWELNNKGTKKHRYMILMAKIFKPQNHFNYHNFSTYSLGTTKELHLYLFHSHPHSISLIHNDQPIHFIYQHYTIFLYHFSNHDNRPTCLFLQIILMPKGRNYLKYTQINEVIIQKNLCGNKWVGLQP